MPEAQSFGKTAAGEPAACELLIDEAKKEVITVKIPVGKTRVTETSKVEISMGYWLLIVPLFILGAVAFALDLHLVGIILLAVSLILYVCFPQLCYDEEKTEKERERRANATRIDVTARIHAAGYFITVESFLNPEERIPLPTVLSVKLPSDEEMSYFAGQQVVWVHVGRDAYILRAITPPMTPIESWTPVQCVLLTDRDSSDVIAIDTPAGMLRVTKTSKTRI